jgi:hypothetical protein
MFKPEDADYIKAVWYYNDQTRFKQPTTSAESTIYSDSFQEIVENNLQPIHSWIPGWIDTRNVTQNYNASYKGYAGIWSKPEGKRLEKVLSTCRNQCWDCHECERTFGLQDIDSALQIRKKL